MNLDLADYNKPLRISYARLFLPQENKKSKRLEFSGQFLLDKKNTRQVKQITDAIDAATKEKWGDNPPSDVYSPLRDGDKAGRGGVPSGATAGAEPYGGHWFFNAKNTKRPVVRNQNYDDITFKDNSGDAPIVSGDYVVLSVNAYAYNNESNGVNLGLNYVQLVRKGEPLGSSYEPSKSFGKAPEADDVGNSDLDSMMS
jgi:hypothetical protein